MSDDAKCYAATPAKTLEQHITDPNIAKNEAEWWACHEILRLRAENEKLRAMVKTAFIDGWYRGNNSRCTTHYADLDWEVSAAKAALGESDD